MSSALPHRYVPNAPAAHYLRQLAKRVPSVDYYRNGLISLKVRLSIGAQVA